MLGHILGIPQNIRLSQPYCMRTVHFLIFGNLSVYELRSPNQFMHHESRAENKHRPLLFGGSEAADGPKVLSM
jgi:hypothetical protein